MSSTSNVGSWTRQTLSRPASISPSRSTRSSRSPVPDVEESTTSSPAVTDSDSSVGQVEHQSRQDRSSSSIPPSLPDSISHAESSHRESNPPTHPSLPNPTVDNRLATENIPSEAPPATKHPLDNFDYEQRFPEDPIYQERSPNARVWRVYLEECAIFDADMIGEARNGLDLLLVFAGLFSAVLSTFVAQTSQALSNNFIAVSTSLLAETVMIQRALANGTSPEMVPRSEMVSGPSSTDFWVNGLWFTSLTLSLCTALLAVLVKQWLHQYMSPTSGTYRDRSLIRQYRYDGLQKWRVMTIVGLLPIVLHITLCFFLVGLVVFLFPLSRPLAYVVASITVIVYGMYFILNILPLAYSQCPYRTPFSDILNVFVHAVPSLFLPFMTFVRGQLKEALSQANGIPTSDESSSESSAHVAASIREFFQHQLRSARRDVVAALDLEAPPPISPKGIPTLKDIEPPPVTKSLRQSPLMQSRG